MNIVTLIILCLTLILLQQPMKVQVHSCLLHPPRPSTSTSQSGSGGQWRILLDNIGISGMHMQLLYTNKVIIFDRTDFGPSNISLPGGRCRRDPSDSALKVDCTAHSILYDVNTNTFRPLTIKTDTWCSSGAVLPNGTLLQTGGFNDGDRAARTFTPCADDESCDWVELPEYLSDRRWYATNQILPDGRVIIVGGRRQFNYEFYPHVDHNTNNSSTPFNFLLETRDEDENNLYPFIHLLPDGTLFIFANTRAISFDYNTNTIIKSYPQIPIPDPRNYPSSGSSVLFPLDENLPTLQTEIMICGGAPSGSFTQVDRNRVFLRATSTCGRLRLTDSNPVWVIEYMPIARVMGDMLILPNGDLIIVNGAELGTAGWEDADTPVTRPVIYRPNNVNGQRFAVMYPASRPRMYHSSAILLPDGRIMVGGSNPHPYYNFTNINYPTDLSLEAYSPPYLSPQYSPVKPIILYQQPDAITSCRVIGYGLPFTVTFTVREFVASKLVWVNVIMPSFTTHSFAMNQRMVVLKWLGIERVTVGVYKVRVVGPTSKEIAPPGYYLLFVVHAGIPSTAVWVNIQ